MAMRMIRMISARLAGVKSCCAIVPPSADVNNRGTSGRRQGGFDYKAVYGAGGVVTSDRSELVGDIWGCRVILWTSNWLGCLNGSGRLRRINAEG
jgi:hypothetical protein